MKKKKNNLKKLKLNRSIISNLEKQQIQGGTLATTVACIVTDACYLYSKLNKPCSPTKYETCRTCQRNCIVC